MSSPSRFRHGQGSRSSNGVRAKQRHRRSVGAKICSPSRPPVSTGVRLKSSRKTEMPKRLAFGLATPTRYSLPTLPHANLQHLSPDPLYPVWSSPASFSSNDILYSATTVGPPCRLQAGQSAWEHAFCDIVPTMLGPLGTGSRLGRVDKDLERHHTFLPILHRLRPRDTHRFVLVHPLFVIPLSGSLIGTGWKAATTQPWHPTSLRKHRSRR